MTTTRSAMVMASRWSWVTTMVVMPSRCWSSQLHLHRLPAWRPGGQRLVQQEQLGRQRQRAGDGDSLPLTARQLRYGPVGEAAKIHQGQQFFHPLGLIHLADATDAERIRDVLPDIQMREQGQRLEDHAESR